MSSKYFNNFQSDVEQTLIDRLVVEAIQIHGFDAYYIPRSARAFDKILQEDVSPSYESSYLTTFYLRNAIGFQGQGDFLSKFGLEIRDQITLSIARYTFDKDVGSLANILRPQEGDLVFYNFNQKLFEIKFVEQETVHYQFGTLQFFDLRCELFEYSNQKIKTGVDYIDNIYKNISYDEINYVLLSEDGEILLSEDDAILQFEHDTDAEVELKIDSAFDLKEEANTLILFTEKDPFSER